jgi:hypothetical protein
MLRTLVPTSPLLAIPALAIVAGLLSGCSDDADSGAQVRAGEVADTAADAEELAVTELADAPATATRKDNPCAVVRCGFGTVCEVIRGEAVCVEPEPDPCLAVTCLEGSVCELNKRGRPVCVPVPVDPCLSVTCLEGSVCELNKRGRPVCVPVPVDPCLSVTCLEGSVCELNKRGRPVCVPVPVPEGEPCGSTVCGEGLVCCNASCGICTPPDGVCIQLACE